MLNKLHEECGVFGLFEPTTKDVAHSVYLALYALQHRGQEACGIVVNDDGVFSHHKGDGLVHEVFPEERLSALGTGNMAVGHVRYSTTGGKSLSNIQPLVIRHIKGNMALAHNGNLVNAAELRRQFELSGGIFHGTSDTEAIAYTIVSHRLHSASTEEAIEKTMESISGAYSCIVMTATKMIAFRDPNGFRPLCLGRTEEGAWAVSSESCALESIGASFVRDVLPGEIIILSKDGVESNTKHCLPAAKRSACVFEYIYFARPDSVLDGASVHRARMRAGAFLAKEHPVDADIVIGVPDSGLDAALGYARESGIPYGVGFIKNKYIGRSFIEPSQGQREDAVKIKLNVIRETVAGKRVIMIDDSIVRGTTCARIVRLLREAGAAEVHMRVSSPPFRHECFFGTDVDSSDNLIACRYDTVEEIGEEIGVDSLGYLSVEATHRLADTATVGFCDGCFTGCYPIPVPDEIEKNKFDQKLGAFPLAVE
ncbi:MAG: amidophosphoribosyltransferase [Clostridia bacterium]|nr:amidophosphoribosyltransferase [Clostridia bacterium]MBQ2693058.1 amidophosphoribosyltransferase [Clostridia bacterium]MBQ3051555.1 amidophosphoribosyltransferase [Clostridia bacterium]MBQ3327602.1 amidophosphoribosyltransferase [Clostridia bacterium]MBQ3995703.1 amidophosphoribosyltransferase [Clostridia bacterium]